LSLSYYEPLYISQRQGSAQAMIGGNQYKSFSYVNGKGTNYIFLNDLVENIEKVTKGDIETVSSISECDAFVYSLTGERFKKDLLFGKPVAKSHSFAMFSVSDFNPTTGIYATLKLENNRGKKLKVIWLKL
jgi:hypothetical protein